jgi:pumilio RNA-binding family
MQSQANHSVCHRNAGEIPGTAGLVVADHVEVFDESTLVSWTAFVPVGMSKEKDVCEEKRDFRTHAMMPCSKETIALMMRFGNPLELRESTQGAGEAITRLESGDGAERRQFVVLLASCARQLALSNQGCRVLQKAIEVVNSADLTVLSKQLEPHVLELAQSPHGNFVLAKMVERMPPVSIRFVIERLHGNASKIAQNKYGCRVLERLIEHCSEEQMTFLVRELIADADVLSRHQFGNFVVSHLLEHGAPAMRSSICSMLLPCISALAMHRNASHVVQKVLDFSDAAMQIEMAEAFLQAVHPNSLTEVACSRYGSYVVQHFARIPCTRFRVYDRISGDIGILQESQYGKRTVESFRLTPHDLQ